MYRSSAALLILCITALHSASSLTPSYEYAEGKKLEVSLLPQSFHGIADLVTLAQAGSPLAYSTVKLTQPMKPTKYLQWASIQTTSEFSESYKVQAHAQGEYGGLSASASSKYLQSQTVNSKTSDYMCFYENGLGTVYLNPETNLTESAVQLLKTDPKKFVELYGQYYVYGITVGCQATSTITITATSEREKKELDASAKAEYTTMFSTKSSFEHDIRSNSAFKGLSVKVSVVGGEVSVTAAGSISEVRDNILTPLDTGGKCTPTNAVPTRVLVTGWLTFPPITSLAAENSDINKFLTPKEPLLPNILARFNDVYMTTNIYYQHAIKCSTDIFSCVTRQWNETTNVRRAYYKNATDQLLKFRNELDKVTQNTLVSKPDAVLAMENKLQDIYETYLKPAKALTPFTFVFSIKVTSSYDDYNSYDGATDLTGKEFRIDPNYEDTENKIEWAINPGLDNGHSNCRHFYGHFYAEYQTNILSVWMNWIRVCGSKKDTGKTTFHPGGDSTGSIDYDGTVRTEFSFDVKYDFLPDEHSSTSTQNVLSHDADEL